MKIKQLGVEIALILFLPIFLANAAKVDRPNVILIMADDLGYGDLGFTGNKKVKTPVLDRMSREGVRLNRFYSGAPVCTPTRSSVMTGRNAFRTRTFWAGQYPLPSKEITIAEMLHDAGYRTGFFGKWHLGKLTREGNEQFEGAKPRPAEFSPPWEQGFDVCFAAEFSVPTYNPEAWDFPWLSVPEGKAKRYIMDRPLAYGEGTITGSKMARWPLNFWREGQRKATNEIAGDSSALITDEAITFIKESAERRKPFLAVIWYFTPHSPVAASNEAREQYPNLPIREQHWFGAITAMDTQIGRVRDELARRGLSDNTLIHFCSDNGPSWVHELGSTGPFRGQKGDLYEGGIHVPGIVEWPARLRGGTSLETPLSTDDLLPTIASITGAKLPSDRELDGENVLPILEGKTSKRPQPLYFHSLRRSSTTSWEAGAETQSAVIDGRWKLLTVDGQKTFQLFDLNRDPGEATNLSLKEPSRARRMQFLLQKRVKQFEEDARKNAGTNAQER